MKGDDTAVKRQQIAPGILMEKFQEKAGDQSFYVIRIELQLFNVLEFNIDFTGSTNVKLQGSIGLQKTTTVQPFAKTEVARLVLSKQWSLKTKFRFSMKLPSLELQRKHLDAPRKKLLAVRLLNEKMPVSDHEAIKAFLGFAEFEFVDPTFPPQDSSLEADEPSVLSKYESMVDWRTPKQIATTPDDAAAGKWKEAPLYGAHIHGNQIQGGKLEDFWLQSALAAIAERPQFVRSLVSKVEGRQSSAYVVNLFEMGTRKPVLVDQYLPCVPLGTQINIGSSEGDLWPSFVEKAFAKLHGGYSNLRLGQIKSGLVSLTNCPTFNYDLKDENSALILRSMKFFGLIKEWVAKRYIVVAGTGAFQGMADSAAASTYGYSIVNYLEIDHAKFPVPNNEKAVSRIVNVRNPWGVFDWAGDWSANSPLWTEQIKTYYEDYLKDTEGSFWISIENLLENFSSLTVCLAQGWHCFDYQSAFVKCADTSQDNAVYFSPKHYFEFTLTERTTLVFGVHQEDERNPGVPETRPNIDIGLTVLAYADGSYRLEKHLDSEFSRDAFLEATLEPGTYLVVPKSVGVFINPDQKVRTPNFDPNGRLERSIFGSIFDKFDQFNRGSFKPAEFEAILNSLDLAAIDKAIDPVLAAIVADARQQSSVTRHDFTRFFSRVAEKLGARNIYPLLKKFGFNENYVCEGMRTFKFTLQSECELAVNIKDALADKMELVTFKLLLKTAGKAIDQRKSLSASADIADVECFFYFNE